MTWRTTGGIERRRAAGAPEMIGAPSGILPPAVVVVDTRTDAADASLFPEEAAVIARAVDERRREFTTVRACARIALARLGAPAVPILPGLERAPTWPAGIVGSLTHCIGYRAAAVAWADQVVTVGIDAEVHAPLPAGVLELIAGPEERDALGDLTTVRPAVCWDRVLFSVKEAIYKAWFPVARAWLGFDDARVILDPDAGTFSAHLLVSRPGIGGGSLAEWSGRFRVGDGLIVAATAVCR